MIVKIFRKVRHCEKGGTAIEYGFIAALIVIASMGALSAMSSTFIAQLNNTSSKIDGAMN